MPLVVKVIFDLVGFISFILTMNKRIFPIVIIVLAGMSSCPVLQVVAFPGERDVKGVYSLGVEKANAKTLNFLLKDQNVDGFSLRAIWKDIEPCEGNFDWKVFDSVIQRVKGSSKKMMLRVIAGSGSPDWIYSSGAKKFEYTDQYIYHRKTYGKTLYMPVPWDETYLSKWFHFIEEFGKRYNGNPLVTIVQMTGPAHGGEMYLEERTNKKLWLKYGWSSEKLVNAWKKTIDTYAQAFPDKQIAIDIAIPVKFDNGQQISEDVVAYGYQKMGKRFSVQGNWLAAKISDDFPPYILVKNYSKKTMVGFQMLWAYTWDNGKRLGGSFRKSIQRGLDAGARYLEIYPDDILNPDLRQDIEYAHGKLNK